MDTFPAYIPKRKDKSPGVIARSPKKNLIIALLILAGLLTVLAISLIFFYFVHRHIQKNIAHNDK
jgi:hypothetical protein